MFPKVMFGSAHDWEVAWLLDLKDDGVYEEGKGLWHTQHMRLARRGGCRSGGWGGGGVE